MGLYESEISKQIHLRNKQKREWDIMKEKLLASPPKRLMSEELEKQLEEQKRQQDSQELEETHSSKKLAAAMIRSARGGMDDTLQRAVDVINNQNGT